jgi:hypothetical protein
MVRKEGPIGMGWKVLILALLVWAFLFLACPLPSLKLVLDTWIQTLAKKRTRIECPKIHVALQLIY